MLPCNWLSIYLHSHVFIRIDNTSMEKGRIRWFTGLYDTIHRATRRNPSSAVKVGIFWRRACIHCCRPLHESHTRSRQWVGLNLIEYSIILCTTNSIFAKYWSGRRACRVQISRIHLPVSASLPRATGRPGSAYGTGDAWVEGGGGRQDGCRSGVSIVCPCVFHNSDNLQNWP